MHPAMNAMSVYGWKQMACGRMLGGWWLMLSVTQRANKEVAINVLEILPVDGVDVVPTVSMIFEKVSE